MVPRPFLGAYGWGRPLLRCPTHKSDLVRRIDYWYTGINRNTQDITAEKHGGAVIAVDRSLIDREALYRPDCRCYC